MGVSYAVFGSRIWIKNGKVEGSDCFELLDTSDSLFTYPNPSSKYSPSEPYGGIDEAKMHRLKLLAVFDWLNSALAIQ